MLILMYVECLHAMSGQPIIRKFELTLSIIDHTVFIYTRYFSRNFNGLLYIK